jgi:hypothetical protein
MVTWHSRSARDAIAAADAVRAWDVPAASWRWITPAGLAACTAIPGNGLISIKGSRRD